MTALTKEEVEHDITDLFLCIITDSEIYFNMIVGTIQHIKKLKEFGKYTDEIGTNLFDPAASTGRCHYIRAFKDTDRHRFSDDILVKVAERLRDYYVPEMDLGNY